MSAKAYSWRAVTTRDGVHEVQRRYPGDVDFEGLSKFPMLLVVERTLDGVRATDLPRPSYDDGIRDVDLDIVRQFDGDCRGALVLIETLGCKRTYYFQISAGLDVEGELDAIRVRYPMRRLEWMCRHDAEWHILRALTRDFRFEDISSNLL